MDDRRELIYREYEDAVHAFTGAVARMNEATSGNFYLALREANNAHAEVDQRRAALEEYDRQHTARSAVMDSDVV
jgi:hypothetical protein